MPLRTNGYQQTSGYVTDATLYNGNTGDGYDRTLAGAAQVSEISALLDLGNSPAQAVKEIRASIRYNDSVQFVVEYANTLAGPWTLPAGVGGPPLAAGCAATTNTISYILNVATTARFWRLSLRNTDGAGCGSSTIGCREIEALNAAAAHINENPAPTSFTVTPASRVTYIGVASEAFTVTLDIAAAVGGEVLSLSDGGNGGTFSPVSPLTILAGQMTGTFTYLNPTPGSYTLTVTDVTSSLGAQQVTVEVGGFKTLSGAAPGDVGAGGLRGVTDGEAIGATAFNGDQTDLQSVGMFGLLAGVLSGGACTASGLKVTIPAGTRYFARQVWEMVYSPSISVPDAATTALWGCSDGKIRQTASASTRPDGFDPRNCCLLTVATTVAGVATVDNSLQERARYADGTSRRALENGGVWAPVPDDIPAAVEAVVPTGHQIELFDSITVAGTLTVHGKMRVSS